MSSSYAGFTLRPSTRWRSFLILLSTLCCYGGGDAIFGKTSSAAANSAANAIVGVRDESGRPMKK